MKSILDIAGIVAIISGAISLIGILIGIWSSYRENKTKHYLEIITKQTLNNFMFVRENSEIVIALSRPEVIDEAKENKNPEYKKTLVKAEVNIEHQLKYAIPEEKDMIDSLRKLVKYSLQYYDNPSDENKALLCNTGDEYYKLITVYDYADWKYIKEQASSSGYTKQYPDFDKIYKAIDKEFKKSQPPIPW